MGWPVCGWPAVPCCCGTGAAAVATAAAAADDRGGGGARCISALCGRFCSIKSSLQAGWAGER